MPEVRDGVFRLFNQWGDEEEVRHQLAHEGGDGQRRARKVAGA
jgi:hypothetical protein